MIDLPLRNCALILLGLCLVLPLGCNSKQTRVRNEMFMPASIRIHPTFTQFKDWNGDGRPDGIEALVEVQDSFGEPVRAAGTVMFELSAYRPQYPEQRGARIAGPWRMSLKTVQDQEEKWNRAVRAYTFRLPMPVPTDRKEFVLSVTFELTSDDISQGRLFDELVLERKKSQ